MIFSLLLFFLSKSPGGHVFSFKNKSVSCIWVAIPADWIILHWYACGADTRSVYGHVITKFSRIGRLPHFLSYGAPPMGGAKRRAWSSAIRKPRLISRRVGGGDTPCTLPLDPPLMHCPGCLNSLVVRIIKRRRINRWINFTYNSLEVACVHPPPPLRKEGGPVRFFLGEGAGLLTLIANRFDTLTVKQWETDKQWCYCFLRPLRKHLTSSSYITLLHGSNLRLELFTTDKDTNCYVKKVCKIPLY